MLTRNFKVRQNVKVFVNLRLQIFFLNVFVSMILFLNFPKVVILITSVKQAIINITKKDIKFFFGYSF